jgi:hypothetical protein
VPNKRDLSGQLAYNVALAVDPKDPTTLLFSGESVWRLFKGSWNDVGTSRKGYSGVHTDQHAIAFHPAYDADQQKTVWIGNDGGAWISRDCGQTFSSRNRGLSTIQVYSLAGHPTTSQVLHAGTQDNGSLRYTGHPVWQEGDGGDARGTAIDQKDPRKWYTTQLEASPARSDKAGAPGSFEQLPPDVDKKRAIGAGVVVVDPRLRDVVFLGANFLFFTHDAMANWEAIFSPDGQITAVDVAPLVSIGDPAHPELAPTVLWVATQDNFFRIERNSDGTWPQKPPSASPPGFANPSAIVAHPTDPNQAYAVAGSTSGYFGSTLSTSKRIFHVTFDPAAGKLQADLAGALEPIDIAVGGAETVTISASDNQVNAIAIDLGSPSPDHLYVGTDWGVFRSLDGGATFKDWSTGLPRAAVVTSMVLDSVQRLLRVGTFGRGVWERPIDDRTTDCPSSDVYMRDSMVDSGREPQQMTARDPLGADTDLVHSTDAIDVRLDTEGRFWGGFATPSSTVDYKPDGAMDYLGFETFKTDTSARRLSTTRIYVQAHNRGQSPADATVRVYWAPKSATGYPTLSSSFWSSFPSDPPSTDDWQPVAAAQTVSVQPGTPSLARFDWEPSSRVGQASTVGLLIVVSAPGDVVPGTLDSDPEKAMLADKHVSFREVSISPSSLEIVIDILIGLTVVAGLVYIGAKTFGKDGK